VKRSSLSHPLNSPSRRSFLTTASAAGLLLGFHLPVVSAAVVNTASGTKGTEGPFSPNAFIRIAVDGRVTLVMPQVEMGQGVYTSLPMIIAEELDVPMSSLMLQAAPPSDALYANPVFGVQATGNSNSVRAFWKPLRKAGAAARAVLVQAAARRWRVPPDTCTTSEGQVFHRVSGRSLS